RLRHLSLLTLLYFAICASLFFSIPPPPPSSTLFPYTTLFRSRSAIERDAHTRARRRRRDRPRAPASDPRRRPRSPDTHRARAPRSEEHTSELQSPCNLVCRLLLEKKKKHR